MVVLWCSAASSWSFGPLVASGRGVRGTIQPRARSERVGGKRHAGKQMWRGDRGRGEGELQAGLPLGRSAGELRILLIARPLPRPYPAITPRLPRHCLAKARHCAASVPQHRTPPLRSANVLACAATCGFTSVTLVIPGHVHLLHTPSKFSMPKAMRCPSSDNCKYGQSFEKQDQAG